MAYTKKNSKNLLGFGLAVLFAAAVAVWQFYEFATTKNGTGSTHLWWAIIMAVLACAVGFLVFSVFLRHDSEQELHITSAPRATRIQQ
jgi:Kef-type K+ transport system membrane component KefB